MVRTVMTVPPVTAQPNDSLDQTFWKMHRERVTALPVADARNHPVGLVALRHFDRAVPEAGQWPIALRLHSAITGAPSPGWESAIGPLLEPLSHHVVGEVMDSPGPELRPETAILDAIVRENEAGVNLLAVVDDDRIVGTVRLETLLRHLEPATSNPPP